MNEDQPQVADYEQDIDALPITNELEHVHQEGNYLVAVSKTGVRFRQRIPAGKILTKKGGKFVFVDMKVLEVA